MDRGAWWATVHGVAKSGAWLAGSMEGASGPRPGPETDPLLWPSSPPLAPQTFPDSDGLCQMDLGDL